LSRVSLWLHGFASKALLLQNKNDLKLVETTNGTRKIISSPKIITLMGKEAIMETFEDEKSKKAVMTLKILPTRI